LIRDRYALPPAWDAGLLFIARPQVLATTNFCSSCLVPASSRHFRVRTLSFFLLAGSKTGVFSKISFTSIFPVLWRVSRKVKFHGAACGVVEIVAPQFDGAEEGVGGSFAVAVGVSSGAGAVSSGRISRSL